jgi:anti-sigma-K factor RskA
MKLKNDRLREAFAAEYVLGTLSARARRRFESHLRHDPALRSLVSRWEQRLTPLADSLPPVHPPRRVWHAIQRRLFADAVGPKWNNLRWWRFSALAAGMTALVFALLLFRADESQPPDAMVTVMAEVSTQRPAMTVSWEPERSGARVLRIRVIGHAEMGPDTAWELWMLPGGEQAPVSLGLITTHETQTLTVPPELASRLDQAWGMAMSVEPRGGSPTGQPTGPVLYKGQCVRT